MKIAFIGYGNVGGSLAIHLANCGHDILLATRDGGSTSADALAAKHDKIAATPQSDAVAAAEVVFLATPFDAIEDALTDIDLAGKVLVDCTNPVGPGVSHGLESSMSGSECVQELASNARVVKAFTIYGFENFDQPHYAHYDKVSPAMLIAGDDQSAKTIVSELCEQMGWEPVDVGALSSALHLEHMTLLWVKMVRVHGAKAGFVWGRLTQPSIS